MIRVGTAGWQYRDWAGVVYPRPLPRGFRPLTFMAEYFDTVEINTSFYGPPKAASARVWSDDVSINPRFRFTAKLWRGFTHERNATAEDERTFREGMDVLVEADRLGAVLIQFPWSFKNEPETRTYLMALQRKFREYPLVLEVRHSSWVNPEMLDLFAETGLGICNIDQPLFHRSVTPSAHTTSRVGYVRLHGRNYRQWFSAKANVRERYDYLYSGEELEPWVDRIRMVAEDAEDTYVTTNNHNVGKAATNALEITSMLTQEPVAVPPPLLEAYPRLGAIAGKRVG